MITIKKIPLPGHFLVLCIYHQDNDVPRLLHGFAANEGTAKSLESKFSKEVLRGKISRYLNHRKNIMDNHGGLRTQERAQLWDMLKKGFDYLADKSLSYNCQWILRHHEEFVTIAPGIKSEFYESAHRVLNEVLIYCKTQTPQENENAKMPTDRTADLNG